MGGSTRERLEVLGEMHIVQALMAAHVPMSLSLILQMADKLTLLKAKLTR